MISSVNITHIRIKCEDKITYDLILDKLEYSRMKNLAKEFGMTNMGQFCSYCMEAILESHYPVADEELE
jgi:hypothetical protein